MKNADLQKLIQHDPLVQRLIDLQETRWFNPNTTSVAEALPHVGLTPQDVSDAHARLTRFAPFIARAFPETAASGGIIESDVVPIPAMQRRLGQSITGELWLK